MAKRIAIATIGTLGDVQPFVALAMTLKKRGYSVVIGTSEDFQPFVSSHGIEFFSLGGDVQAFLRQAQFDSAMTKSLILYAPMLLPDPATALPKKSLAAPSLERSFSASTQTSGDTACPVGGSALPRGVASGCWSTPQAAIESTRGASPRRRPHHRSRILRSLFAQVVPGGNAPRCAAPRTTSAGPSGLLYYAS